MYRSAFCGSDVSVAKQVSTFRYLPEWLESREAFAIAPTLPLAAQPQHFSSRPDDAASCLPGPISDASPDAWGREIITRSASRGLDELDYLVAVDDKTRQGGAAVSGRQWRTARQ